MKFFSNLKLFLVSTFTQANYVVKREIVLNTCKSNPTGYLSTVEESKYLWEYIIPQDSLNR